MVVQDDSGEFLDGVRTVGIIAGHLEADTATGRDLDALEAGAQAVEFLCEEVVQVDGLSQVGAGLGGHDFVLFSRHICNLLFLFRSFAYLNGRFLVAADHAFQPAG